MYLDHYTMHVPEIIYIFQFYFYLFYKEDHSDHLILIFLDRQTSCVVYINFSMDKEQFSSIEGFFTSLIITYDIQ